MKSVPITIRLALASVAAAALATGCSREGGPFLAAQHPPVPAPVPDAGVPIAIMSSVPPKCTPAASSQMVPPRASVVDQSAASSAPVMQTYFTSDLFNLFKSVCGGCHVDSNLGNFSVSASTFPTVVNRKSGIDAYSYIVSKDQNVYMPPFASGGIPFEQRPPTDAVVVLANLLDLWESQGSPFDAFVLPTQQTAGPSGFTMTAALGAQLTNIGSCIPEKGLVGTAASTMDQLDAMFGAATALPSTLDQTDLNTLDSAVLAQNGVISYAPTYPLWSDNAVKMRYVRVPRGQHITFDKAAQKFTIPPNTRFYKTFSKAVVDITGKTGYRKIETRVIVSRPDTTMPDGTAVQNALFGTYVWSDDETQATLLNDPLRNGKPFADRIFTYITNEQKAQPIIDKKPANLEAALSAAGVTRHYALPGSERCVQCHMGSPSNAFVLGFTPLQVARRPTAEGGVFEPATGDELTQLQRLIDYGVIKGVSSPSDILPLEKSQGSRAPRNQQELAAQAYMVGNCAHCHNPRGFPSVRQPAIKDVLDFLPGAGPNEGIFQFDLQTVSPIRKRGLFQDVPIPYITPSLYDFPSDSNIGKYFCPDQPEGVCAPKELPQWVLAPWRSLIYRNTDTPYDYFDDFTPFPHMPLDTSGYDCRVAQLMGDWMVSIPSRIKDPTKVQSVFPNADGTVEGTNVNTDPQPYEEMRPGDSDYQGALGAASARLASYHAGHRYGFCPTTYTDDIIDPVIQSQVDRNLAVQSDAAPIYNPKDLTKIVMPPLAPIRPDYITFDDTDPPGDWYPRRPDWSDALVDADVDAFIARETVSDQLSPDAAEDLGNVIEALKTVRLTPDVVAALEQQVPFALWDTSNKSCDFSNAKKAGSFTGADRPQWMSVSDPPADAPVLVESAGAAVFTTVCFNCHGVLADSKGLLADEITTLTGGGARVANLRDGLFGPLATPGGNRERVFGPNAAQLGLSSDEMAARYIAWMTLGGTEKHLPQDVLTEVSQSPVAGEVRSHIDLEGTPDMLRLGLSLCEQVVGADPSATKYGLSRLVSSGRMGWSDKTGLIDKNGDAEMWLRLCNLGNRAIVRVPVVSGGAWTAGTVLTSLSITGTQLYWGTGPNGEDYYGANPVMNERGGVDTGLSPTNMFPICIQKPTDPTQLQIATAAVQATKIQGNVAPFCPPGFITPDRKLQVVTSGADTDFVDGRKWAARGAINAALAVFLYLDQIEKDPSKRQILYNQCSLLSGSP